MGIIYTATYWRDANSVPITADGVYIKDSQVLSANNTTAHVPIFGVTGSVEVRALYGVVTTAIGVNNTAASWRVNDQAAQIAITAAGGTTLSAAPAGSMIVKKDLASAALTLKSSAAGAFSEPTTLETPFFSPFTITQKTAGAATNIEFTYTTTDAPTTGAIDFWLRWLPLSADANVVAL